MHQDFKQRLLTWKNDLHPGEIKKVFVSDSPMHQGEYLIRLEKGLSGTLTSKVNEVKVSNQFLTVSQQHGQQDSSTDISHLNKIIYSLEREFNDLYEQIMHETFSDKLNRYAALN